MPLKVELLGTNEDGTPHLSYVQTTDDGTPITDQRFDAYRDDPAQLAAIFHPVIRTGPATGTVTHPDGTSYSVSPEYIEVHRDHHDHVVAELNRRNSEVGV